MSTSAWTWDVPSTRPRPFGYDGPEGRPTALFRRLFSFGADTPESTLVERAKRGDRGALDALYRRHAPRLLCEVLLPRVGDRALAEDALAETFRAFLEQLERYEDRGRGVWPLLATIATNRANDLHRRRASEGRQLARFTHLLAPTRDGAPVAEDLLADAEAARALGDAVRATIETLGPRDRDVLRLRFFEDRPRERCAAELGLRVETFDVALFRALRRFEAAWRARTNTTETPTTSPAEGPTPRARRTP